MIPREAHLWAIGFDDVTHAECLREEITALAGEGQCLLLLDIAILTRTSGGAYTLDREPFPLTSNVLAAGTLGFLAGLALSAPIMTGATVAALLGTDASTVANAVGMEDAFIRDVKRLMKPGMSALLVLDEKSDLEPILHSIRGLGGTVLKTNVDLERAKLVQAALSPEPALDDENLAYPLERRI